MLGADAVIKEGVTELANIIQVIKYEGDNNTFIWKHS